MKGDSNLRGWRPRTIIRLRRRRDRLFGSDLFGEPAWDMLLELYAAELAQRRECVSGLCCASGVPATTALRWITLLVNAGWVTRRAGPVRPPAQLPVTYGQSHSRDGQLLCAARASPGPVKQPSCRSAMPVRSHREAAIAKWRCTLLLSASLDWSTRWFVHWTLLPWSNCRSGARPVDAAGSDRLSGAIMRQEIERPAETERRNPFWTIN